MKRDFFNKISIFEWKKFFENFQNLDFRGAIFEQNFFVKKFQNFDISGAKSKKLILIFVKSDYLYKITIFE